VVARGVVTKCIVRVMIVKADGKLHVTIATVIRGVNYYCPDNMLYRNLNSCTLVVFSFSL